MLKCLNVWTQMHRKCQFLNHASHLKTIVYQTHIGHISLKSWSSFLIRYVSCIKRRISILNSPSNPSYTSVILQPSDVLNSPNRKSIVPICSVSAVLCFLSQEPKCVGVWFQFLLFVYRAERKRNRKTPENLQKLSSRKLQWAPYKGRKSGHDQ